MARIGPAVALLGVWLAGGLGGAGAIAQSTGDLRYLALAVVTAPLLILTGLAIRRAT